MQITMVKVCHIIILSLLHVTPIRCWQYFTKFKDLIMIGSDLDFYMIHSEYYFGECRREGIILYTSVAINNIDVLGKKIIRGWLKHTMVPFERIPTCILARSYAEPSDQFRATAYNFQMCVPRITYCHSKKYFRYFYYEWYIPTDFIGGMDWVLYFYGPPQGEWQ